MIANEAEFKEVQHFQQKWLQAVMLVFMLGVSLPCGYGMIKQLVFGHPWGNRPLSDAALAIVGPVLILMAVGLFLLFRKMKLITEVREDGLHIRFVPLSRRTVPFENIVSCEARTYKPIREYGGWGLRYGRSGKAYNVSGNRGVQLQLSNGKGLLIGSQHPEELALAIQAGISGQKYRR